MTADPVLATARVERVLPAPPRDAYAAWVDPEVLAEFVGPSPATATVEIDPRVGGRMRIVMTFPDRRVEIEGAYLVLDPPHRISFSWSPIGRGFESVVAVTFEPHGDSQTLMTITHTRLPQAWHDGYVTGWGLVSGQLAAVLARRVRR